MLLEAFLKLIFGLVDLLVAAIPTIELPQEFFLGMEDVTAFIAELSYVLPVNTFLMCLSVIFILQNARLFVSIFNFIIRKIPTVN